MELVLRSDDRDRALWPTASDFELRLPYALRGVRELALVWVRAEPSEGPPLLLRIGEDSERLLDSGEATALVGRADGQLTGPPVALRFWPCPTLDRLRVRVLDDGGVPCEALALALRAAQE